MSDITELETRLASALDRIRSGLDAMPQSVDAAPSDDSALQAALDDEKTANAQLEERVKVLKGRQDTKIAELEARVEAQRAQMAKLDGELQKLRTSSAELTDVTAHLRSAAEAGAGDAELINRALIAEVEALSAQRAADAAEVDAILTELKPLIKEA